jgi:hypothetical protein
MALQHFCSFWRFSFSVSDLGEKGWCDMGWIDMAQDRDQWKGLVNTVMILRAPQNARKFLSSCATGGLSRMDQPHVVMASYKQSVGLFVQGIIAPHCLDEHKGQHKQNYSTKTAIPRVGQEPTISVFGREKPDIVSDLAATVIGTT